MPKGKLKKNIRAESIFCTIFVLITLILNQIFMKTFKLSVTSIAFLLLSAILVAQTKPWAVPPNFKSMKNTVATSDASVKAGQALYVKTCTPCHGKTGLGDGVKSKSLKTPMNDFTKAEVQGQTDGELFYKTKTGRGDMTKYEGKLTDDDIWSLVNYIRTLKK
jgi:mono/diheme cytochrome c family protein